jgi:hypothetical protein
MTPEAHDAAFAAVSHLPHLISFALMNAISGQPQGKDYLSLAGPGFRDFTRIAASDPKVWRDIMLSNREELLAQSKIFQRNLQALEVMISSGNSDALEGLIEQASNTRASWSMTRHHKYVFFRVSSTSRPCTVQAVPSPSLAPRASPTAYCCWPALCRAQPPCMTCLTRTTPASCWRLASAWLWRASGAAPVWKLMAWMATRRHTAEAVHGQCRHRHAPADRRVGGDGWRLRLRGIARMHERPIGDLVDALRQLGCQIDYLEQDGFPPLRIGKPELSLDAPFGSVAMCRASF